MWRRTTALIAIAAMGITVTACGDSDDGKTTNASGGEGKPIKVFVTGPTTAEVYPYPEIIDSVKAGVEGINRRGGINGSMVEIESCDNGNNPNKAAQCAQQAVKSGAVAMVGSYALIGSSAFYGVIEPAKMPNIGNGPTDPKDWSSPMSFPVAYTAQAYVAGVGPSLARKGCKRISIIGYEDPSYDKFFEIAERGIEYGKATPAGRVRVAPTTADFTPAIAQVVKQNADCVMSLGPGNTIPPIVRALRNSGKDIRLGGLNHIGENLSGLGNQLDGSATAEPHPDPTLEPAEDADPMMKRYAEDMKAAGITDPKKASLQSLSQWLGVQYFAEAAAKIPAGQVTSETLVEALESTPFDPGIAGVTDFSKPAVIEGAPRLHNFTVFLKEIKDGKRVEVEDGKIDLTPAFAGTSVK